MHQTRLIEPGMIRVRQRLAKIHTTRVLQRMLKKYWRPTRVRGMPPESTVNLNKRDKFMSFTLGRGSCGIRGGFVKRRREGKRNKRQTELVCKAEEGRLVEEQRQGEIAEKKAEEERKKEDEDKRRVEEERKCVAVAKQAAINEQRRNEEEFAKQEKGRTDKEDAQRLQRECETANLEEATRIRCQERAVGKSVSNEPEPAEKKYTKAQEKTLQRIHLAQLRPRQQHDIVVDYEMAVQVHMEMNPSAITRIFRILASSRGGS